MSYTPSDRPGSVRVFVTPEEKSFVLRAVAKNPILASKEIDGATLTKKKEAWARITDEFNRVPTHSKKSVKQIRKLWNNIRMKRKSELLEEKRKRMSVGDEPEIKVEWQYPEVDAVLQNVSCELKDPLDNGSCSNFIVEKSLPLPLPLPENIGREPQFNGIKKDGNALLATSSTNNISSEKPGRVFVTPEEKTFVLQAVAANPILTCNKEIDGAILFEKKQAWAKITEEFNKVPTHSKKTVKQIRKLWNNIRMKKKSELLEERRKRMANGDLSDLAEEGHDLEMAAVFSNVGCELRDTSDSDSCGNFVIEEELLLPMSVSGSEAETHFNGLRENENDHIPTSGCPDSVLGKRRYQYGTSLDGTSVRITEHQEENDYEEKLFKLKEKELLVRLDIAELEKKKVEHSLELQKRLGKLEEEFLIKKYKFMLDELESKKS